MNELKVLSYDLRKHVVDMIIAGKGGHIGGDMSVMEILVELYMKQMNISPENKDSDNRDRFVLSKGHSVESYYAVLAKNGGGHFHFQPIRLKIHRSSQQQASGN